MAWLSPTSISWISLHLVLLLIGIVALDANSYFPQINKPLAEGIGGSLIATGIAGEVLFLYVKMSESVQARLELFTIAGLLKIFPHRSVRIREEYDSRLKVAREVDVVGFGQSSFREDYRDRFLQLSQQAIVRIVLIDPDYPSPTQSFAAIRDREEGNTSGQIKNDVEAFEHTVKNIPGLDKTRFRTRRLRAIPSVSIFRIDDVIFWGPYLIGQQSRNMPTLLVQKGGFLFDRLNQHFEEIWNNDQFSRDSS